LEKQERRLNSKNSTSVNSNVIAAPPAYNVAMQNEQVKKEQQKQVHQEQDGVNGTSTDTDDEEEGSELDESYAVVHRSDLQSEDENDDDDDESDNENIEYIEHAEKEGMEEASTVAAASDNDDNNAIDDSEDNIPYNVTKAFNRLRALSTWGFTYKEVLLATPIDVEEMQQIYTMWGMFTSMEPTQTGEVIWGIDLGILQLEAIKALTAEQHLRFFWYFLHVFAFDVDVQENGVILFENLNKIGFFQAMSMIPPSVKSKIDKLSQGAGAIKLNKFIFYRPPGWMNIMMGIMKLFISKKLMMRMTSLGEEELETWMQSMGGKQVFPSNVMNGVGCGKKIDRIFKKELRAPSTTGSSNCT